MWQQIIFIASIQLARFSSLPASIRIDIGVPSGFIECNVKVNSKFLKNKNEDDGDFESFGGGGHLSSISSIQFGQLIVEFSVIKHSPLRV